MGRGCSSVMECLADLWRTQLRTAALSLCFAPEAEIRHRTSECGFQSRSERSKWMERERKKYSHKLTPAGMPARWGWGLGVGDGGRRQVARKGQGDVCSAGSGFRGLSQWEGKRTRKVFGKVRVTSVEKEAHPWATYEVLGADQGMSDGVCVRVRVLGCGREVVWLCS